MRSNCDDNVNLDVFVFSQGKKGWALDSPGGGEGAKASGCWVDTPLHSMDNFKMTFSVFE